MTQQHSRSRGKQAQALAEMAVMVPFLVIGMMGMLDLGRAFYYQIAITNAVREGARYAAEPYYFGLNPSCANVPPPANPGPNCVTAADTTIQDRVNRELTGTGFLIPTADILVTPDQTQRVTNFTGATTSSYPIKVSASFQFNFITPIIGSLIGNPLTIKSSAVFRAEY
ncbi:MAG: pilus assembly protein [Chloroflexi bacterium]|nr:MAG: pilus assembly protein [Chloroflexota bacterium]